MTFGYIILRHVNSAETNQYWKESLRRVRKVDSQASIVIIDDNSDSNFLDEDEDSYSVVQSEQEERGSAELLPFLLLSRYKWFDRALIIHDSVFLNSFLGFRLFTDYEFLWSFEHRHDDERIIKSVIQKINCSEELLDLYEAKDSWRGAFGAMGLITLEFLERVEEKFSLTELARHIKTRSERMALERILALMCTCVSGKYNPAHFGDVHRFFDFGGVKGGAFRIGFDSVEEYNHLPIVKCWSARLNEYDG